MPTILSGFSQNKSSIFCRCTQSPAVIPQYPYALLLLRLSCPLRLSPVVPEATVLDGATLNYLHAASPIVKLASTGPRGAVWSLSVVQPAVIPAYGPTGRLLSAVGATSSMANCTDSSNSSSQTKCVFRGSIDFNGNFRFLITGLAEMAISLLNVSDVWLFSFSCRLFLIP